MSWAMLCALNGVLLFIAADILRTLADSTEGASAARRSTASGLVFFALAIAIAKGWL